MTRDEAREKYIDAQGSQVLAHGDDDLAYRAEIAADNETGDGLRRDVKNRAGFGDMPQLRRPLGPTDTIADYLRWLGHPGEMTKLRRRAAAAEWDGGACQGLGGPAPPAAGWQLPDVPYLAFARRDRYDGGREQAS